MFTIGHTTAVVPVVPETPVTPEETIVIDDLYDIVASCPLPVIDISRSVRTLLFNDESAKKLNHFLARHRKRLFLGYMGGFILTGVGWLAPAAVGRWVAYPMVLLSFSAPATQVLLMRVDIVKLLFQTYDFWFFSSIWFISMAVFAFSLADMRALIVWSMWMSMQVNIMIDATTSFRGSLLLTMGALVTSGAMIVVLSMDLIDEMPDYGIVAINQYALSAHDLIVNGWSTCLLVLARNIYRRRAALRDHGANKTVVQCISYRCRVRLHAVTRRRRSAASSLSSTNSVSSISSVLMTRPTASNFENAKMVKMRCMRFKVKVSARNLVVPIARRLIEFPQQSWFLRVVQFVVMCLLRVSVVLTVLSFHDPIPHQLRLVAFISTALVSAVALAVSDRRLLKHLIFSFDFAFLSLQLTIMHVGLCDLYKWDSRAFSIGSSWLAVHFVILFECIPPVLKTTLQIRYRAVGFVAVLFLIAQVALFYQFVVADRDTFHDRAIFTTTVDRWTIHVTVLPLLVSRMPMTFGWACRIVWRLAWRHENELILIQGTVTYINNRRKILAEQARFQAQGNGERTQSLVQQLGRTLTRRASALFANAVVPTASALSITEPLTSERDGDLVGLTNQLSLHGEGKMLGILQHQQSIGGGTARSGMTVFDASNANDYPQPVVLLEQAERARRFHPSSVRSHASLMKLIVPLDTSVHTDDGQQQQTLEGALPRLSSDHSSQDDDEEAEPAQPRFVI